MYRLEIAHECTTYIDGICGHFEGLKFCDYSSFEDIEETIQRCLKFAKKYNDVSLTFRLYNDRKFGEGIAFGRICTEIRGDEKVLTLIRWNKNDTQTERAELNKKAVKAFILEMVQQCKNNEEG